jgi:hypothetical protein
MAVNAPLLVEVSLADKVKLKVPTAVALPPMTPAEEIVSPFGKAPAVTEKLEAGPLPVTAVIGWL